MGYQKKQGTGAIMDDAKIIELYFSRDERAIEETERKYGRYLFSVVYNLIGNKEDSEECLSDTCALYYADNDSEDIGILKEGQTEIASVFTFSQNHYAYQEKIDCHDGHIYWIAQANVSGNVTDHYTFIDYNYLDRKPTEIDRTFSFYRNEIELYLLRFNKNGDYSHIDLCQP